MNILKRLFNWIQSGPVDFSYVTGEWGFKKGDNGRGRSNKAPEQERIPQVSVTVPTKVAVAAASNDRIAARVETPVVANINAAVPEPVHASIEGYDPGLVELFSPAAAQAPHEQDAYVHIHAER
ncbi:MAG TPA: hypothetical protein VG759_19270 [Candidatus Angelobacter sp.]|nr:hypothetical protein [Candidatus Angelobacter sp.]